MISKMIEECEKINDLSTKESVEFLLNNNYNLDEDVYTLLKMMILSQIHLDETAMSISKYYFDGDTLSLSEDGIIIDEKESKARDFFGDLCVDNRNRNFEKMNNLLKFVLENSKSNNEYTDEDIKYFEQYGNGNKTEGFSVLKKKTINFYEKFTSIMSIYNQIKKNKANQELLNNDLQEIQIRVDNLKKQLKGNDKKLTERLHERIFERNKRKTLQNDKKREENNLNKINEKIKANQIQLEQLSTNYVSPADLKQEFLEILDICERLNKLPIITKRTQELREILIKLNGNDLEKNEGIFIPIIYEITQGVDNYDREFAYLTKNLILDITSQVKSNIAIYDRKNLEDSDLITLISNIRKQMKKDEVSSNTGIEITYRNESLKPNFYLKGATLNNEQITNLMDKLNLTFEQLKTTTDIEKYIRGCANIFQEFLMLHPYTDGNGRTARTMLTIMLARKNIFIPNLYDSYNERESDSMFIMFGDEAAKTGDFQLFQDYLLARVQKYNPKIITGDYSYLQEKHKQLLMKKYYKDSPNILTSDNSSKSRGKS